MVILTVALVSMAELMAITLRMQQLGRNQTLAARLAQDKVDELMSVNWAANPATPASLQMAVGGSLTADVANHFDVPGAGVAVNTTQGNRQYRRRWLVQALPGDNGSPAGSLRRLTVRVIPIRNDNRTSNAVELVTILRCWPCP